MASSFALPVIPGGTSIQSGGTGILPVSASRTAEPPNRTATVSERTLGRKQPGAIRAGFHRLVMDDLRSAYVSDKRPWVVGFSGGKDSTCLMQLVYYMLARLPAEQRVKPVYVLASDTRVEAPSISRRIRRGRAGVLARLALLSAAAERDGLARLPVVTHGLVNRTED